LIIIDLNTSIIIKSFDLPGQKILWRGIFVQKFHENIFTIYLTSNNPNVIWQFNLNFEYGFPFCAWNINGIEWNKVHTILK